ncbi:MAG TPA: tetratricopeptide repeat protein [Alphaproteobacteria bacterium]|nr:tetratricopeptide repeat protein [Alphaproteobacteria bacterium]
MAQNVSPPGDPYLAIAALADSGQAEAAERQARELVARAPEDNSAWRVLGYALLMRNRFPEAESALRCAIELAPRDAVAFEHLGWIYHRTNRLQQAADALKSCLAIVPDRLRGRVILANVLVAQGKPQHAIAHFERALKQEPRHFRAHNNLANVLVGLGRLKDAAAHYAEAAGLSPDLTYKISAAHQARRIGDWETAEAFEPVILSTLRQGPGATDRVPPFPLLAMPGVTAQVQLAAGRQMAGSSKSPTPVPRQSIADLDNGKLRIGYLSPDLHDHPLTHLFSEVPELHDRSRFEIIAFDYSRDRKSVYRDRVLAAFDKVVTIRGMSDQDAARAIAAERIAIAVDLTGWTTGSRSHLLGYRPAPVAMQWLGFPGTLGAPWIDYIVADPVVAPPGSEAEFSEKLLRLPHSYQSNDRKRRIGDKVTRAAAGLPEDAFVFCSFNQAFKINRGNFALWMDLLRARPDSVLWLLDDNRWATEALRARTRDFGVAPERVIFAPRVPMPRHLARLRLADLALDAPPYGSHTTCSDALWAGTPHLAFRGETFASRVVSSLLTAIGLPELIADDVESYRAMALRLASDRAHFAVIRARLAANRLSTPLFDSVLFTRHLEAGYEAAWRRCRDGLPPDHIDVPA